ncbi:MAG: type II/IV secretion system protein [Fibrobacter sp.]|nr:type II/IV secretion system protein [Fibrobacter sp.]
MIAKHTNAAIIQEDEIHCSVAVIRPHDELLLEKFRLTRNKRIEPVQKSEAEIRNLQIRQAEPFNEENLHKIYHTENSWESEPVINLVDSLIEDALEKEATDIHIEPDHTALKIRIRQDGLLNDFKTLPHWISDAVLVRLKILAEVDITDKRIPHDGSFTFSGVKYKANIRLSTIPIQSQGVSTEKCVLRLLPQASVPEKNSITGIEQLHLPLAEEIFLKDVFDSPQGLFLVTGPTGSGKTTTLHAGLQQIAQKKINIVTIEDPVEYVIPGINQVQVNEKCGFSFAEALRSILRQDPDVIFVGEIRDSETAKIAIRAAQTGHLVLSTLHTNNSKAAHTRLQDLGIGENSLRETLLGVMAQRLVRKKDGQSYKGRTAITEILKPDGTFVCGTLRECAQRLVEKKITDLPEVEHVLGKNLGQPS